MEVEILFEPGAPDDQYPISSPEEGGVGKSDDRLRVVGNSREGCVIKLFLNPRNASMMFSRQLCQSLTMPDIVTPETLTNE